MKKKEIGINIKKYRKELHLTQDQLAEKVGTTKQCISSWETDRTQPSMEMLEELANALGCSSADINVPLSIGQISIRNIENYMTNLDEKGLDRVIALAEYLKAKMRDEE